MITETEIFAALDKPRSLYAIQQRVGAGRKDTEELQIGADAVAGREKGNVRHQ